MTTRPLTDAEREAGAVGQLTALGDLVAVPCAKLWTQYTGAEYTCSWPALCPECEQAHAAATPEGRYAIEHSSEWR